jgi:NAD-dependent SIR2 family protein deacetylase
MDRTEAARRAGEALSRARALVVTAGAGMGVDSGLPDFRGAEGFWKAYPPYQQLGLRFEEAANPGHFVEDPPFGWGFYGHRANLYRETQPHEGFAILRRWIADRSLEAFVVTSNVDGHFQKAGFPEDRIYEVHGSIHVLQCTRPCSRRIWPNTEAVRVDVKTMRAADVPLCPSCGAVARPNILMFGNWGFMADRTEEQGQRFDAFLRAQARAPMVVVEIGAGAAIPTIRMTSERLGRRPDCLVVRINPREASIPPPHVALSCGAVEGLRQIDGLARS